MSAGITFIDGHAIDEYGNPMSQVGCPNCGKGKRWVGQIEYFAASNSGRDLAGPCSRRCKLQLEYAEQLAERRGGSTA